MICLASLGTGLLTRDEVEGIKPIAQPGKETTISDDPKKTALDRKLIAIDEPHEVRSWTESLGVTADQLREAVKAVGNSAEAVRAYLAKK